ncbi:MAG: phage holin family protein [Candidatus Pacebacteria bacterium]|nr:phage holin family protein [Candidatus Paceibacterota bacterium]
MINRLFFYLLSGIIGIFIATKYIPGISFSGTYKEILLSGAILGLVNFFIKPILKIVFLPFRIITFGLFTLIINVGLVFFVMGFLFKETFEIEKITGLILTTFLIWLLSFILCFKKSWKKS